MDQFEYDIRKLGNMHKGTKWLILFGILLLIMGLIALGITNFVSVISVFILGIFLLSAGVIKILQLRYGGWSDGGKFALFSGVLYLLAGLVMVINPVSAAVSLTLIIAIFIFVAGILRLKLAFTLRPMAGWGLILSSAVISLLLGIMLMMGWPNSGLWFIGLVIAIEMISAGATLLTLGLSLRKFS